MSNKLTNDLTSLIFNTGQVLREKAREKTKSKNCSFLHMQTLHFIKDGSNVTMKDLASYLHITPPSATSLVNSLVNSGLAKRVIKQNDRRAIELRITKSGMELLKNKLQKVTIIMEAALNKLSAKEKIMFMEILKKIS